MLKTPKTSMGAEDIAIQALGFIAADPERLGRFLAMTGIGPATLRSAASEPGFLAQVMEFLSQDDSQLMAFAANAGLDPARVAHARHALDPHKHEH